MGGSWSNPKPEADQPSALPSQSEATTTSIQNLILVVEDSPADVFLIREVVEAAKLSATVQVVRDGEQAIRFFEEADNDDLALRPALVILDINLPEKTGRRRFAAHAEQPEVRDVPVVVVSSSESGRDREEMMKLGANRYFAKPSEFAEFMKLGDMVKELLGD